MQIDQDTVVTLAYSVTDSDGNLIDAGEHPLIYLHGGGWVWNSVDTHDRLMRSYAAGAGCMVVGPDYSLSPEARFPAALEECAEVVRQFASGGLA